MARLRAPPPAHHLAAGQIQAHRDRSPDREGSPHPEERTTGRGKGAEEKHSTEVPQQVWTGGFAGRERTVACGDGRRWTCCLEVVSAEKNEVGDRKWSRPALRNYELTAPGE